MGTLGPKYLIYWYLNPLGNIGAKPPCQEDASPRVARKARSILAESFQVTTEIDLIPKRDVLWGVSGNSNSCILGIVEFN